MFKKVGIVRVAFGCPTSVLGNVHGGIFTGRRCALCSLYNATHSLFRTRSCLEVFHVYFIFEAFPYPRIMGQNWPLSRDLTFFLNKRKLTTKKTCVQFNFVNNSYFSSTNSYLCKKKPLKS